MTAIASPVFFLLGLVLLNHNTHVVRGASIQYTFGGASVVQCENTSSQCSSLSKQIIWQWQQQQPQTPSLANISRSPVLLLPLLDNSNSIALGGIAASAALAQTPDHSRAWFISRDALRSTHDSTTVYGSFFSVAYRSSDDSVHVLARSCAPVTCKVCLLFAPAQVLPALNTAAQMQQARCFSSVGGDEKIFEFLAGDPGEIVAHRTSQDTAILYENSTAIALSISPLDFVTHTAVVVVTVVVPYSVTSSWVFSIPPPSLSTPNSPQTNGTTITTSLAPTAPLRDFVIEPNVVYGGVYSVDSATLAYTNALLTQENLAHFSAIYIGGTLTITLPEDFLADAQYATADELTLSLFSYDNVYGKFDALVIDDALGTLTSCQNVYAEEVADGGADNVFQVTLHIENVCQNGAPAAFTSLVWLARSIVDPN